MPSGVHAQSASRAPADGIDQRGDGAWLPDPARESTARLETFASAGGPRDEADGAAGDPLNRSVDPGHEDLGAAAASTCRPSCSRRRRSQDEQCEALWSPAHAWVPNRLHVWSAPTRGVRPSSVKTPIAAGVPSALDTNHREMRAHQVSRFGGVLALRRARHLDGRACRDVRIDRCRSACRRREST